MTIKTTINYSPNFDPKKRKKKQVKYIVLHYTGMKSEKAAIDRLSKIQSVVSTHYFIRRNGKIMKIKLFNLLSPTYLIDISDIDKVINPFINNINL